MGPPDGPPKPPLQRVLTAPLTAHRTGGSGAARYAGKNPRKFHEKYKELNPEQYPSDVQKVMDAGKTPAGSHRAIMVEEVLRLLAPQPGEVAIDCTLGFGGHARAILECIRPADA